MNRDGPERHPPIRVLYVHHAGAFGGASRSLLELIKGFPVNAVAAHLVTQRGSVAEVMTENGIEVITASGISQLDDTRFNHYRGKRWLLLARELAYLPFTACGLMRARRRWREIDLVHVNELTALPALLIARWIFDCPIVVHVRSVQRPGDGGVRSRLIGWTLRCGAAAVIAIDRTVAASLPAGTRYTVVHNGFTPELRTGDDARPRFGDTDARVVSLRVGIVGSFLGFKGVREFVEAARICRDRGLTVRCVIVGSGAGHDRGPVRALAAALGLLHDVESEIRHYVAEHGLQTHVRFTGFVARISEIYRDLDVLCFPSHLDAVGRPVYEAASWKIPSIVAVRDPQPDTMIHGETGLCIASGDAVALADAIAYFHDRPQELKRMGEAAARLARENFDSRKNAARVVEVYRAVLARRDAARGD